MNKCAICNRSEELDKDSDYLRPLYIDTQGRLANGLYKPHLTLQEKWKLKAAGGKEQVICSNRANCRKRYSLLAINNSTV
jgi:hypothetical protein